MKRYFKTLVMFLTCMAIVLCVSCKKDISNEPDVYITGGDGFIFEHEYVDLGLTSGTLWATCNVGAYTPLEYGKYFAWGETTAKGTYTSENYKWYDDNSDITKYNTNPGLGIVDNKTVLDPEDDAAHVNWGGDWRMPTSDEMQELIDECTWKWTSILTIRGFKVTGPNGKSIFLPAAGFYNEFGPHYVGENGSYWSSSLYFELKNSYALAFPLVGAYAYVDDEFRDTGRSVRPVCSPKKS